MELGKKIVPVIVAAIVFGIVGYFIGTGAIAKNQGASVYSLNANAETKSKINSSNSNGDAQSAVATPKDTKDVDFVMGNPKVNPAGMTFRQFCFLTGGTFSAGWEGWQWVRTCSYPATTGSNQSNVIKISSSSPEDKVFTAKSTTSVTR